MEAPTEFAFKISTKDLLQSKGSPGNVLGGLVRAFVQDSIDDGSIDRGIIDYLDNNPDATHFLIKLQFGVIAE